MFSHPFFSIAALALLLVSTQAGLVTENGPASDFLEVHNLARHEVGVAPMVWSEKLAEDASLYARYRRDKFQCKPAIVNATKYGVGNNQLLGDYLMTPSNAVNEWVIDKEYYNHTSNSCSPPNYSCRDYTQVVWRNSNYLGCTQVTCGGSSIGFSLTVCFYYPPGNIPGETPY